MGAIITFFEGLADAIVGAIDFLIGFIEDIVYIVKITGEFVLQIPSYLGWLPSSVLAIIVVVFGVVVIYKVMGREG